MRHALLPLLLCVLGTLSCSQPLPETPIYNIHEYCRKSGTDPAVIAKMQQLGIDISKEESKYYEPKSRTDYKYINITTAPQTGNIQGLHIKWKKDLGGLTYEEIQQMMGITLPKRGDKVIHVSEYIGDTWFYVLGHENPHHPNLLQVTVTCEKNNYDVCWEFDITCSDFVHD